MNTITDNRGKFCAKLISLKSPIKTAKGDIAGILDIVYVVTTGYSVNAEDGKIDFEIQYSVDQVLYNGTDIFQIAEPSDWAEYSDAAYGNAPILQNAFNGNKVAGAFVLPFNHALVSSVRSYEIIPSNEPAEYTCDFYVHNVITHVHKERHYFLDIIQIYRDGKPVIGNNAFTNKNQAWAWEAAEDHIMPRLSEIYQLGK
jgi:hypothetical protein